MTNKITDQLLRNGTIRVCGTCGFKTTERTEMRLHCRQNDLHFQDRSMQREVKSYSEDEKVARARK